MIERLEQNVALLNKSPAFLRSTYDQGGAL